MRNFPIPIFLIIALLSSGIVVSCGSKKHAQTRSSINDLRYQVDSLRGLLLESKSTNAILKTENRELKKEQQAHLEKDQDLYSLLEDGMEKEYPWTGTQHFDLRKPNFVIIHHTAQNSTEQTIRTFKIAHTKVSAHYIISRNGEIFQVLNDYFRAWHAGIGKWGNIQDLNSSSLGIELDNNGKEPFSDAQIQALLGLLAELKSKYKIPQTNFLGHGDIAPGRKHDPSVLFPWKRLAEHGFGLWYNEDYLLSPPTHFDPLEALRLIGYDISNPRATIRAFKRKFMGEEVDEDLTEKDIQVIYNLYKRYL